MMNELNIFLLYEILYLFHVFYYDANTHSIRELFSIYFLKNIRIKESIPNKMRARCLDAHMWQRLY